jgi:hypothetical protein
MARKRFDSPVNIDVKAGARIDLRAKIPSTSVGRFVDAITDLFRPFSEARGLRADQIRLQRADVAIEIAKRARATLAIENMEVSPVPNKILVPLIEKASNESVNDDFMIDRWAHLLATASASGEVEPRFVGILGELNGKQAKALEIIAKNRWEWFARPVAQLIDADSQLDVVSVRKGLNDFSVGRQFSPVMNEIYDELQEWINRPGGAVVDILVFEKDDSTYSLDASWQREYSALDLDILASLGLLKRVNFFYNSKFKHEIQVIYYHMTELGVNFFLSCNRDIKTETGIG